MRRNIGTVDRTVRIIAGLEIISAGLYFGSWWGAIGVVPLVTALVGWCPPYALFGIKTYRQNG